jgi:hypothetical protein
MHIAGPYQQIALPPPAPLNHPLARPPHHKRRPTTVQHRDHIVQRHGARTQPHRPARARDEEPRVLDGGGGGFVEGADARMGVRDFGDAEPFGHVGREDIASEARVGPVEEVVAVLRSETAV